MSSNTPFLIFNGDAEIAPGNRAAAAPAAIAPLMNSRRFTLTMFDTYLSQRSDPDIPVAHRVAVVLQGQRQLLRTCYIGRSLVMSGRPGQLHVVLHQDAVVQH